MHVGDGIVEGVDTLKNHYLIGLQLDGFAGLQNAHAAGKFILGHKNSLAPAELGEMLVHKIHIKAERALQIHLALGSSGNSSGVNGLEIVVHANGVCAHATAVELLRNFHGGGCLAAAAGAGEEHDGAALHILDYLISGCADLLAIALIALGDEARRVGDRSEIDFIQLIAHRKTPLS